MTRCTCDEDPGLVSIESSVTTAPGTCPTDNGDLGDGECETSMIISDSDIPGSVGIFRAATTILTDGNTIAVSPSEIVSFLAGNSVTLNPDFYAQSGSVFFCLLYTSPSPRDKRQSRMPSSA